MHEVEFHDAGGDSFRLLDRYSCDGAPDVCYRGLFELQWLAGWPALQSTINPGERRAISSVFGRD